MGGITLQFFLPMEPPTATHQTKSVAVRNGKPCFFEPPELLDARAKLAAHLGQHAPEMLLKAPIRLLVKWCFAAGNHADGEWKTTKPDTDNLQKLLKDVMTDCKFWGDDAHVASEISEKFWAATPGIFIRVEEI